MNDDLIKRSDAAEVVYKALKTPPPKGVLTDTMSLAIALVQDIPSADRPQGEWKDRTHYTLIAQVNFAYCSECGQPIMHEHTRPLWNYCPNCGARMKGLDDE